MLLPVPDTVALWLGVWLLLPVPEGVKLGLAPALRVPGAEGLWLALRLLLLDGDAVAVPEPDGVQVLDPVGLTVIVGELLKEPLLLLLMLAVPLLEAVLLGEAPEDREAVGLTELVELMLSVDEEVGCAVPLPEPVGLVEPVGVCVAAGEALPERETVLLALALAPLDRLAVAEVLCVVLALTVLEGVTEEVPVGLWEDVAVPETVGVMGGLVLPLRELLPLLEGEAPAVREAVGD